MQKASYPTDIMRFRQYIGSQYGCVENSYKDELGKVHPRDIQVPCIPKRRRNELEKLPGIFDQEKIFDNKHLLDIEDEDFPEEFRPIIRRLASALRNSNMMANMKFEDNILRNIQEKELEITTNVRRKKENVRRKKKLLQKLPS
jgi:hypothetical protein